MNSSNCSWLGIFKLPGLNSSQLQELLHVVRAASCLKPGVRWKKADTMTEDHFMFFHCPGDCQLGETIAYRSHSQLWQSKYLRRVL